MSSLVLTSGMAQAQDPFLHPGVDFERALGVGEIHRYRLAAGSERLLLFTLTQQGVDLTTSILGPEDES